MKINYTIVIPHKNIPDLLERCINSIPDREDIQILVVDDNSSLRVIEQLQLIVNARHNVELILTCENKGAGFARNIGLSLAQGIWLLFSDADDFYTDSAWDILDSHSKCPEDAIFWACTSVLSNNIHLKSNRHEPVNYYVYKYLENQISENDIKFKKWEIWSKMYKRSYIEQIEVKFDETFIANDIMFVIKANFYIAKFKVIPDEIYCITYREDSITFNSYTEKKYRERIDVLYRLNVFCKKNISLKYCMSLFVAGYRTAPIYRLDRVWYVLKHLFSTSYSLVDEVKVCIEKLFRKN